MSYSDENLRLNERVLVVLNGDDTLGPVSEDDLAQYRAIIAVDGGLNRLYWAGVLPNFVIGDMDSVSPAVLAGYRDFNGEVIVDNDQSTTDFEKTLVFLMEKNWNALDIVGFQGDRPDHLLGNLHVAMKHLSICDFRFLTSRFEIRLIGDGDKLQLDKMKGIGCSIIPLMPSKGVVLNGFEWPLDNEDMSMASRVSVSNIISESEASVSLTSGCLAIQIMPLNG